MNATPRLRSAFPATPQPRRTPAQNGSPADGRVGSGSKLPDVSSLQPAKPAPEAPLVPFDTIDAPSQRLYVAGFYAALFFYRLYDFYNLTVDEAESLWLFMKWVAIDGTFLFGLPALRIPWLEWSSRVMIVLFLLHALVDGVLMFRIPIPLGSGLVALTKVLYDREIAISERRVKPADILNNPQLILGRQIVNILPEASAILNPDPQPFCLGPGRASTVSLPLQINQTIPLMIELERFDLETWNKEIIKFSQSQIKKLRKHAQRTQTEDPSAPLLLELPVKKPGLYQLSRIQDQTRLDVSKTWSEALVVSCPTAEITSPNVDRCRGDLSNLSIRVFGTPPLKVKYRRTINAKEPVVSFQTVQPSEFSSALVSQQDSEDMSAATRLSLVRAKSHTIDVPLNEALGEGGRWFYSIEEITDALGNAVSYDDAAAGERTSPTSPAEQGLFVHERPRAALRDLNMNRPLLVAVGESAELPIRYSSTGKADIRDAEHVIQYRFTPSPDSLSEATAPEMRTIALKSTSQKLIVQDPGTYSLQSVKTDYCEGEILEPSSCTLINPKEPKLEVASEPIAHRCAGSPIGLRVDLRFSGTPPFRVEYTRERGNRAEVQVETFNSLRGQVEFKPNQEGNYTYKFLKISDKIYHEVDLVGDDKVLQQSVKPSVSAVFASSSPSSALCLGDSVSYDVRMQGEGPWKLEYELARRGNRAKSHAVVDQDLYRIETPSLQVGGDYSLMLTSVTDNHGCKEPLKQDVKFSVRHEKPEASFGPIEGKRTVRSLDYKAAEIPLRLSGEGPWDVRYARHFKGATQHYSVRVASVNGVVKADGPGRYEITGVQDRSCAGVPSEKGDVYFDVETISRPGLRLPADNITPLEDRIYQRNEVCEGDEDFQTVQFQGRPPYSVKYREQVVSGQGSKSLKDKEINVLQDVAQVKMDTSQAGDYTYAFSDLGDSNYDAERRAAPLLTLKQKVNSRPSAMFAEVGKVYSFCQGQEHASPAPRIPIKLTGQPPFTVELELKPQARLSNAQTIHVPNIEKHTYSLEIPTEYLKPGTSFFTLRGVRDSKNCERRFDTAAAPRIQVSVHDPPSITPLEDRMHYCIGERITYTLSGAAPFTVNYLFQDRRRSATISSGNTFRRIAETPGEFIITEVRDSASACAAAGPANDGLSKKIIHEMPSVRISKGRESKIDIHAGGSAQIHLAFGQGGTPPFEFTYTRSENSRKGKQGRGGSGALLETRTLTSNEHDFTLNATEEGTYEVVAIRDRYCSFAKPGAEAPWTGSARMLQN